MAVPGGEIHDARLQSVRRSKVQQHNGRTTDELLYQEGATFVCGYDTTIFAWRSERQAACISSDACTCLSSSDTRGRACRRMFECINVIKATHPTIRLPPRRDCHGVEKGLAEISQLDNVSTIAVILCMATTHRTVEVYPPPMGGCDIADEGLVAMLLLASAGRVASEDDLRQGAPFFAISVFLLLLLRSCRQSAGRGEWMVLGKCVRACMRGWMQMQRTGRLAPLLVEGAALMLARVGGASRGEGGMRRPGGGWLKRDLYRLDTLIYPCGQLMECKEKIREGGIATASNARSHRIVKLSESPARHIDMYPACFYRAR